jgi:galactan 5-O-arabinofuranosyltransferase
MPLLEGLVAFAASAVLATLAAHIRVDPMQRIGAISGLASLQLRFAWIALPLLVALVVAARPRYRLHFPAATRLVCAGLAGLASGFVAGGLIVALRGTPYCLYAHSGDSGTLGMWADAIAAHDISRYPPPFYPPLFPWLLSAYTQLTAQPALYALKDLEIAITALAGPLAYLAWRSVLRPGWALAIGVVAMLALLDPYKPYENIVLVVFVPLTIRFLSRLRRADEATLHSLLKSGTLFGIAYGALCLAYSGWFHWSAPGVVAAALIVCRLRDGRWRSALVFGGVTLVVFGVVLAAYLWNIETYSAAIPAGTPMVKDGYIYYDVTDPAYFAMWKGDLPGTVGAWPPPGEVAGLGVYQLFAFGAFGIALALARVRSAVVAIVAIFASAWLLRFWYARSLYHTHLVQLYPRTSLELACLAIMMIGLAAYYCVEYVARKRSDSPLRSPDATIGALVGLALVIATAASSISDRYMPAHTDPMSLGELAWRAHDEFKQHVQP